MYKERPIIEPMTQGAKLLGSEIIAALKQAEVTHVAALPDITTSAGLLWPLSKDPAFALIRLCKEDEGISICAGLALAGKRSVLLMQHTGLLDSLNAVEAVAVAFDQPICMIVGLLGKEPDVRPRESTRHSVRVIEPILDAMKVDTLLLETGDDIAALAPAIEGAYRRSRPMAALVGRSVQP